MRTLLLMLAISLSLLIVPSSVASCDNLGNPSLGFVELSLGDPSTTFYLVDPAGEASPAPMHLYQESSGIFTGDPALDFQRDWHEWYGFQPTPECVPVGWDGVSDTLIF